MATHSPSVGAPSTRCGAATASYAGIGDWSCPRSAWRAERSQRGASVWPWPERSTGLPGRGRGQCHAGALRPRVPVPQHDFATQRPRNHRIHPETVWRVEERVPQASVEDLFLECEPWGVSEVTRTTPNVTVVPVVHRQNTTLRCPTERLKPGPNAVVPEGHTAREHDEPYVGIGDRGRRQDRDDPPLRHTGHGDVIRGNAGCSEPRDLAGNRQCIGLDIGVRTARLADDDEFTIGKRLDRPAPVIAGADGAGGAHQFDDPAVHVEEIAGAWIDLRWHVVEDFPVGMNRPRSAGSYSNHSGQH